MKKQIEKSFGVTLSEITPNLFKSGDSYFMGYGNDKENFTLVRAIVKKNPSLVPYSFIENHPKAWEVKEPEGEGEGEAKLRPEYAASLCLGVRLEDLLTIFESAPSIEIKKEGLSHFVKMENINRGGIDILTTID